MALLQTVRGMDPASSSRGVSRQDAGRLSKVASRSIAVRRLLVVAPRAESRSPLKQWIRGLPVGWVAKEAKMLVLSRKETDKIVFPTLGITVEVLRIRGNVAKIGVDAPSEVPIYRHELTDRKHLEFSTDQDSSASLRQLIHAVRHRLDAAAEALNRLA
jgi:carbon storage regulator CsrA